MNKTSSPTIRDLYPDLTEQELQEAEYALDQYLIVVLQIFERTEAQSPPEAVL